MVRTGSAVAEKFGVPRIKMHSQGNNLRKKSGGYFMKKAAVFLALAAAIVLIACLFGGTEETGETAAYLRVHIRANSNGAEDQAVKYEVRDGVVEYLTPVVAACETKEEAVSAIEARLEAIEGVAERILLENGYAYGARASVRKEEFPTRVYDGATLPAGVYDALIVELGTGEGDNWWCVVYPPLCFTGGNVNITYKSKIMEIIRSFFGD